MFRGAIWSVPVLTALQAETRPLKNLFPPEGLYDMIR
jgi:hypothetical protein